MTLTTDAPAELVRKHDVDSPEGIAETFRAIRESEKPLADVVVAYLGITKALDLNSSRQNGGVIFRAGWIAELSRTFTAILERAKTEAPGAEAQAGGKVDAFVDAVVDGLSRPS